MHEHRHHFAVLRMATVLGVSRSGFYRWQTIRHSPSLAAQSRQRLDERVLHTFELSKLRDGARRVQAELASQGERYDVKTMGASMQRQSLVAKAARKFKVTTDSHHGLPVSPNLLGQDFETAGPNEKWAGDITYLMTSEGWLYLAVMMDLHSRTVIGWSMSTRMTAELVCDALEMALWRRNSPHGVIVHSDRGSQYCSHRYRYLMQKHALRQSMSRKGNCWDTQSRVISEHGGSA